MTKSSILHKVFVLVFLGIRLLPLEFSLFSTLFYSLSCVLHRSGKKGERLKEKPFLYLSASLQQQFHGRCRYSVRPQVASLIHFVLKPQIPCYERHCRLSDYTKPRTCVLQQSGKIGERLKKRLEKRLGKRNT